MKFSSTEDLDDLDTSNSRNPSNAKDDEEKNEETKSYTNTVNSKEFRDYLNRHGLVLFPVKNASTESSDRKQAPNLKKKTMMKRLSSMFTRSKMPYSSENEKAFVSKQTPNRKLFYANSRSTSEIRNNARQNVLKAMPELENVDHEDWKSSISSVLSAADTEDYLSSPICVTRKAKTTAPSARFQRNQLNQTMQHQSFSMSPDYGISSRLLDRYGSLNKREIYYRNDLRWRQVITSNNLNRVQPAIDPFEMKKHTDGNFRKDSSHLEHQYHKIPQQNCSFNVKSIVQSNTNYQNNLKYYESPRSSLAPSKEMSREEVMNKIYDYYRKSVNNTPVSTHFKENCYSTLPIRPTNMHQAYGFVRISNPIQNQQKIYDEVRQSSTMQASKQDHDHPSNKHVVTGNCDESATVVNTSTPKKVDLRPVTEKRQNHRSPKGNNSSQRISLYNSQVFRPIAEFCSKIFNDPRTPTKYKKSQNGNYPVFV